MAFPTWLRALLVIAAAAIAYAQSQTFIDFSPVGDFALGLGQVVIAAALAAQTAVTRALRAR